MKFILSAALLLSAGSYAQTPVSTSGHKYVLIEEITGAWCGFCPDGKTVLDQVLAAQPYAIGVSFHDTALGWPPSSYENLACPNGHTFVYTPGYLGSNGGFPCGTIDCVPGSDNYVGQNRSLWPSEVSNRLSAAPMFDITMSHSFVHSTRTITINVTAKALAAITGDYNMNVLVTEDSIPSVAPNGTGGNLQHSYLYNNPGQPYYMRGYVINPGAVWGLPSDTTGYYHDLVVKEMLGSTWGTTGIIATNAPSGGTYTKTYTYVVPASYSLKHIKLTAIIQKNDAGNANDRPIANSIQAKLDTTAVSSVAQINPSDLNLEIAPNPATNLIHVKAFGANFTDTKITIDNAIGQTVFSKDFTTNSNLFNENISLSNLSNGIYFVNFFSEGLKTSKKIIVSK